MKKLIIAILVLYKSYSNASIVAIPAHFDEGTKTEIAKLDAEATAEKSLAKKYFLKVDFALRIMEREGIYSLAEDALKDAQAISKKLTKPQYGIYADILLSNFYTDGGDRKQALAISTSALERATKINDTRLIAFSQNSVARNLKELGRNPEAHQIWKEMYLNGKKLNDEELILGGMMGMFASMPMEPVNEWRTQGQLVIDQAKKVGAYDNIAAALNNMADVDVFAGNLDKAESLRKEAIETQKMGDEKQGFSKKPDMAHLKVMLAKVLALKGDRKESEKILDQGKALALLANVFEAKAHGSLVEASLIAEKGDLSRATDLYNKVLKDSAGNDSGCEKFAFKMLKYISEGGKHPPAGVIAPQVLLAGLQTQPTQPIPQAQPSKGLPAKPAPASYGTGDRGTNMPKIKSF